jgi:hypothetical protein
MKQESNWKRCVFSSFAVAAMLSVTAIDTARGDHAAAFAPKFQHAPTDPMDGVIEVKLNANGNWVGGNSDKIFWRFMLGVEKAWYAYPPPHGPVVHANVSLRAPGYPQDLPCTGDICEGGLFGEVHMYAATNMLMNALWPASPQYKTLDAPAYKVLQGEGSPGDRCMTSRNIQMANGAKLHTLLAEGFTVEYKVPALMATGGVHGSDHQWTIDTRTEIEVPLTIRCLGNPEIADKIDPPPPGDIVSGLQVTSAMLAILPNAKTETSCPVDVAFIGRIYASGAVGPTEVKYRFEFATGQKSTEFSTTLQPGAEYANVSHQATIPLTGAMFEQPGGGGGQGGGGGVGLGGQGGLAAVQKPDDDFPIDPKPKPFELKGEGLPSNKHKNDVRLRVLSHGGGKVVSNSAGYHIVCEPKAAIQPVGPMTAPAKPEPPAKAVPVVVTPGPKSPPAPILMIDPVPQLVCTNGRVVGTGARATCVCPRGQERRDLGRNRFRCERPVVQVTCRGGTVRGNDCVCARTLRKVQTGPTAWRCERPAAKAGSGPSTVRPATTIQPAIKSPTQTRPVICQGGTVRRGECVCPRGQQKAPMAAANAWRCFDPRPARGSSVRSIPAQRAR